MKLKRFGAALSILTAGAVILSACGNNNATGGSGPRLPVKVTCGGQPTLKASGSTAQENAMNRFVKAFEQVCPGQSVNYTPNGSGAGISEFIGNQTDFGGSDSPLNLGEDAHATPAVRLAGVGSADGVWPHRRRLQRPRLDVAEPQRSGYGPDLQRPDHHVERCGDPAAELGHEAARRADSGRVP